MDGWLGLCCSQVQPLSASELETRFDEAAELTEIAARWCPHAERTAQIDERWCHTDFVCDLNLGPPLPDSVAVIGGNAAGE